jgi:hypothetical protein
MKCPTCPDTTLVMADRQGIEIDYCPSCRGVWLDRGELDKIIERTVALSAPAPTPAVAVPAAPSQPPPAGAPPRRWDDDWDDGWDDDRPGGKGKKKKRRSSLLEELFDFG